MIASNGGSGDCLPVVEHTIISSLYAFLFLFYIIVQLNSDKHSFRKAIKCPMMLIKEEKMGFVVG